MEEVQKIDPNIEKSKKVPKKKVALKKLTSDSLKSLLKLREQANKKPFGRKIRDSQIIELALQLVTEDHLKALQDASYSEQDRLKMVHDEYVKTHGRISLDEFIGKLLRAEISIHK